MLAALAGLLDVFGATGMGAGLALGAVGDAQASLDDAVEAGWDVALALGACFCGGGDRFCRGECRRADCGGGLEPRFRGDGKWLMGR